MYSIIDSLTHEQMRLLTQEKPGARYNLFYQAHPHLAIEKFYKPLKTGGYEIATGLLEVLGLTKKPDIPLEFTNCIKKNLKDIEPFPLYDFQIQAVIDALYYKNLFIRAATGSGKSAIIAMLVKLLSKEGLKGMILVPNISLVNQFGADLKTYSIGVDFKLIGGSNKDKSLHDTLTISTWQSQYKDKSQLPNIDYLIIDEAHQAKAHEIFEIAKASTRAKYKIGLTGTIPQNHYDFLKICSVFGVPKSYVSPRQLIDAGLGTNIKVNILNYQHEDYNFNDYQKALAHIIKCSERNTLITKLAKSLSGNTIILSTRNEHIHRLFRMLMPCETTEKSYKDFALQNAHNIFFINGSIPGEQREIIRNALEVKKNAILVSNYSVLSTGINIRNLHNLIFAAPLKSYILITQSLGRLIRTHESKEIVNVYDICDNIGFFIKQKRDRIKDCYAPQNYEIRETNVNLRSLRY